MSHWRIHRQPLRRALDTSPFQASPHPDHPRRPTRTTGSRRLRQCARNRCLLLARSPVSRGHSLTSERVAGSPAVSVRRLSLRQRLPPGRRMAAIPAYPPVHATGESVDDLQRIKWGQVSISIHIVRRHRRITPPFGRQVSTSARGTIRAHAHPWWSALECDGKHRRVTTPGT